MLRCYSEIGDVTNFRRLFARGRTSQIVTADHYAAMIACLGNAGRASEISQVLDNMKGEGLSVTCHCLENWMVAAARCGDLRTAKAVFTDMMVGCSAWEKMRNSSANFLWLLKVNAGFETPIHSRPVYSVKAQNSTLCAMVEAFGLRGKTREAMGVFNNHKVISLLDSNCGMCLLMEC